MEGKVEIKKTKIPCGTPFCAVCERALFMYAPGNSSHYLILTSKKTQIGGNWLRNQQNKRKVALSLGVHFHWKQFEIYHNMFQKSKRVHIFMILRKERREDMTHGSNNMLQRPSRKKLRLKWRKILKLQKRSKSREKFQIHIQMEPNQ